MVIGGVFDFRPSQVNPVEEILPQNSTLSIIGLNYTVTEWMGPWWKGACFRRQRKKIVLNDVTMQLKTGQITAILGNSGITTDTFHVHLLVLSLCFFFLRDNLNYNAISL